MSNTYNRGRHHDPLICMLIKLRVITPAAARVYLMAQKGDVSFYVFRYAHNMRLPV